MLKICDYCGRKLHFWNQSYLIHPDGDEKTKLCCSSCERKIFDPLSLPSEEAKMIGSIILPAGVNPDDAFEPIGKGKYRLKAKYRPDYDLREKRGCRFHPDRDGHVVVVSIDGDAWAKFILCRECGLGFIELLVKTYEGKRL